MWKSDHMCGYKISLLIISCPTGALPPLRAHLLRRVRGAQRGGGPARRARARVLRVPHAAAAAPRALLQHPAAQHARLDLTPFDCIHLFARCCKFIRF